MVRLWCVEIMVGQSGPCASWWYKDFGESSFNRMSSKKRGFESVEFLKCGNKFLISSPKCQNAVMCGVLTKSPMISLKTGGMFSM